MRPTPAAGLAVLAALVATGSSCGLLSTYESLEVGQCLPTGAPVEGRRGDAPDLVPCSEPHRYEVFARQDLDPPGAAWPGQDLVDLNAERLCGLAVEGATGAGPASLPDGVLVVHVAPSESSWQDGDREVECLFRFDQDTVTTLVTP